jgi:nifR3 family TIM-barrel protein
MQDIRTMRAYGLPFTRGFFLAPLSGYTDWAMRVLCREYGAELAYTEMISAAGLIRNTKNTGYLLARPENDAPLIAQIFTSSPREAAQAASMIEDQGFSGIDINMGCPVKKVVSKGAGVALMTDPDRALSLAHAVVKSVSIPVSVKMRAGWDTSKLNAVELAQAFEKAGVNTIILHPRTRSDMYRGRPRWEILQDMKRTVMLPVVGSGDIKCTDDLRVLSEHGADGFMVGRAAIGRPWVFRELMGLSSPPLGEQRDVVLRHLDMLCSIYGSVKGLRHMRKFISSYVKGLHGASHFRAIACAIESPDLLMRYISDFFKNNESS